MRVVRSKQWRTKMIKILIALFNSLFFFGFTFVFVQNWVVPGIVAGVVWLVTFFALCLSTMSHNSNILDIRDLPYQSYQESHAFIPQGARGRSFSPIAAQKRDLNPITRPKETAYSKSH